MINYEFDGKWMDYDATNSNPDFIGALNEHLNPETEIHAGQKGTVKIRKRTANAKAIIAQQIEMHEKKQRKATVAGSSRIKVPAGRFDVGRRIGERTIIALGRSWSMSESDEQDLASRGYPGEDYCQYAYVK